MTRLPLLPPPPRARALLRARQETSLAALALPPRALLLLSRAPLRSRAAPCRRRLRPRRPAPPPSPHGLLAAHGPCAPWLTTWEEGAARKLAALACPGLRGLHPPGGPARLSRLEVALEGQLPLDSEGPALLAGCTQLDRLVLRTASADVVEVLPLGLTAQDLAFLLPPELLNSEEGLQQLLRSTTLLGRWAAGNVACRLLLQSRLQPCPPAWLGQRICPQQSSAAHPENCCCKPTHPPTRRLTGLAELRFRSNANVPAKALPVPFVPPHLRQLSVEQPFLAGLSPHVGRLTGWGGVRGGCLLVCRRPCTSALRPNCGGLAGAP